MCKGRSMHAGEAVVAGRLGLIDSLAASGCPNVAQQGDGPWQSPHLVLGNRWASTPGAEALPPLAPAAPLGCMGGAYVPAPLPGRFRGLYDCFKSGL